MIFSGYLTKNLVFIWLYLHSKEWQIHVLKERWNHMNSDLLEVCLWLQTKKKRMVCLKDNQECFSPIRTRCLLGLQLAVLQTLPLKIILCQCGTEIYLLCLISKRNCYCERYLVEMPFDSPIWFSWRTRVRMNFIFFKKWALQVWRIRWCHTNSRTSSKFLLLLVIEKACVLCRTQT